MEKLKSVGRSVQALFKRVFTRQTPEPKVYELLPFPGLDKRSVAFRKQFVKGALTMGLDPNALATVICLESKFNHKARNPHADAYGLIQWMPFLIDIYVASETGAAAKIHSREDFYALTAIGQLPFIWRFYSHYAEQLKKHGDDAGAYYLCNFMPSLLLEDKPDSFVVGQKHDDSKLYGFTRAKLYEQNSVFDFDRKSYYTVGDVKFVARSMADSVRTVFGSRCYLIELT